MTNEELFDDLKQFIDAKFSQQMADVATKDDLRELDQRLSRLDGRVDRLDQRFDTLDEKLDLIQDAIADSLSHHQKATTATLDDHEQRLRRLEHRSA